MGSECSVGRPPCLSQQPWQSLARADGKVTFIAFMGVFIRPIISPWSEGLVRSAGGWGTVQEQRDPGSGAGETFPLLAAGMGPCSSAGISHNEGMPQFWGHTKHLPPPQQGGARSPSLLAATGTPAHALKHPQELLHNRDPPPL